MLFFIRIGSKLTVPREEKIYFVIRGVGEMEGIACEGPRHEIIVEIHLGNCDDGGMRGKNSDVRHALDDLGFVGILSSADFGDRFF